MKILVANPSVKSGRFLELEKAQLETWMSNDLPNVQCFFYYGSAKSISFKNGELHLRSPESEYINEKTFEMFDYCLKNLDFDFIFRTNLSSYLNLDRLYKYCTTLSPQKIYQGFIGHFESIRYANGSGILLSRDVIELIFDYAKKVNVQGWHDDPYIGKLIHFMSFDTEHKIKLEPLPRFNFLPKKSTVNDILKYHSDDKVKNFHYRCKSFEPMDPTRKIDCDRIKLVHKSISSFDND